MEDARVEPVGLQRWRSRTQVGLDLTVLTPEEFDGHRLDAPHAGRSPTRLFAVEGRHRPYDKLLAWELQRCPAASDGPVGVGAP